MKRGEPPKRKTPLKRGGPIRKRGKKMEEKYVDRRAFVTKILSERPYC